MKKIALIILIIINIEKITIKAQFLVDSLSAFYPFSKNSIDESGRGNNATLYNGVAFTYDRLGRDSMAVRFDGGDDYISIPSSQSFNFTVNQQFTMSFFIYPELGDGTLFSKWGYGFTEDDEWIVALYEKKIRFHYHSNPDILNGDVIFNDTITLNKWTHIALAADFNILKIKLFINGILSDIRDLEGNGLQYTNQIVKIGNYQMDYSNHFKGCIDDIRFYKRALLPSEVYYLAAESMVCYQSMTVTDTLLINLNPQGLYPQYYKNTIKVFPNPSKTYITIDCGENFSEINDYKIKIINPSGKTIHTAVINKQIFNLDLLRWGEKGVYFIQIYDNNDNLLDTKKIVIK